MKRRRTKYLGVSKEGGDGPIVCGAWINIGPKDHHNHGIAHLLLCKAASHNTPPLLQLFLYDFEKDLLSDSISDIPQRDVPKTMAVHPQEGGVICAFDSYCKMYGLESSSNLSFRCSEKNILEVERLGGQHRLLFSHDGYRLAATGQDGHLRVFEWPSLNMVFHQPAAHRFLDFDISLDGAFLACIVKHGSCCYVWDVAQSKQIAALSSNHGEHFGFCKFSQDGTKPFLFITTTQAGSSCIAVWNMDDWRKLGMKKFLTIPITAVAVGQDGQQLAIASSAGDIHVIEIKTMTIVERIRSAHLSQIISLDFSPDCRALLSTAADSMVRVTALKVKKDWKEWHIYMLLALMVLASAILFYILFECLDSFWNFPLGRNQPAMPSPEAIYGSSDQ